MGCVCGKPVDTTSGLKSQKASSGQRVALGRPVGGEAVSEERRVLQLAAAEKRAEKLAQRGMKSSRSQTQADTGSIPASRLALISEVKDAYSRAGKDAPFGLNLASEDQLRRHLDAIRGSFVVIHP